MLYKFDFRPYRRKFKQPLKTSHGVWEIREGIILRLATATGKIGWGEIAPLSWFGSETLATALDFCRELPPQITDETIASIPDRLPACQFAFESAKIAIAKPVFNLNSLTYSGLLPAGETALNSWQKLWYCGYRTFKWKIAVNPIEEELKIFESLVDALPKKAKLRLDANEGLSLEEANRWLEKCDNFGETIEFMEQPLAVREFEKMLRLSDRFSTPIALDESVASWRQME
ncbi:MAG: o-succinylbenzoate synthase, partial [Okeania sp. SIO2H7]|nr:o-succinylbenzoate synthase [Okeania sp. SIO2H7]